MLWSCTLDIIGDFIFPEDKLSMKASYILVMLFLITMMVITIVGCTRPKSSTSELKILSHHLTNHGFAGSMPQSTATVTGRAQNSGTTVINYAQIAVNYYDKNGILLATSSAVRRDLNPGEIWDYTILFQGPDAWKSVRYEIAASAK